MPNKANTKGGRGDQSATLKAKLSKLRQENRKLRTTIDDIWNVVTEDSAWTGSTDRVSQLISTSLPERYELIEDELPGDASQDAAILFQGLPDAEEKKLMQSVAAEMGLSAEEFSQSQDVDAKLMALRRLLFRQYQIDKDPAAALSDAEYLSLVAGYFTITVGLTANFPLSLKAEAIRFIDALDTIKKNLDKGKREPNPDVQIAEQMLEHGYTLRSPQSVEAICQSAITAQNGYEKNYSEMLPNDKRAAKRKLLKRIDSLYRQRRSRAVEAAVKMLGNGSTLDDSQSAEMVFQQTITLKNGYGKNYSDLSDTAKRSAGRKLLKEINSRLRKLRSRIPHESAPK